MDVTDIEMAISNQMMQETTTPVDVVFILQSAGIYEDRFNNQKEMTRSAAETLFNTYTGIRMCVIEYKADYVSVAEGPTDWHGKFSTLSVALDNISYENTNYYCNYTGAISLMLNDLTLRENASKGLCYNSGHDDKIVL